MYRIHMVEDEDEAAGNLRGLLDRYASERGLDFSISRDSSALPFMERKASYDLVFLDIQMPGINGMEAAEALRQHDQTTPIVFVTNLAQYAVKGYEVNALDFVVKPVTYAQIAPRLAKMARAARENARRTLAVTTATGIRVLDVAQLEAVEVSKHDLFYHVAGEKDPLRTRGTMAATADELADAPFMRVSASCLVGMPHIERIDGDRIVMRDGKEFWFSRAKRKGAMEQIARYLGGRR